AANRLGMDTDTEKLIAQDLPWRQRQLAFDRLFPQYTNNAIIVVDGATPDIAEDATAALAKQLASRSDRFTAVQRPDGGAFFQQNGVLFLPVEQVQALADQLIAAQPLIGTLAADPTAHGLFSALNLALEGVARGETKRTPPDAALAAVADTIESAPKAQPRPLGWQTLLTGRQPEPEELRHFILVQPKLNFGALEAGASSARYVHRVADRLDR